MIRGPESPECDVLPSQTENLPERSPGSLFGDNLSGWAFGRMDSAGRRRTLRSIGRASESSGFEAACGAALRVVEGGRVPDDATVDVLARRIAGGGRGAGGADLSACDGFLKGAAADGS